MNEIEKRIPHPEATQPSEAHESQPGELYTCCDCGAMVCDDCVSGYTTCDCCGDWYPLDEITTAADGSSICEDCLSDGWFYCDDCGEWHRLDVAVCVNRGTRDETYVCEECAERYYHRCFDCGEYYDDSHIDLSDAYHDICCRCTDDWVACNNCGEILLRGNAVYDGRSGECYCEDCAPRSPLHDYGYKPEPVFGTTDKQDGADRYYGEALTFGVELECDDGDDVDGALCDISDLTDRCYCKHDGSLDEGYEIVTHPGTLAWHKERFPWSDVCRASVNNGFRSHDTNTCGLHVHVGRGQMGEDSKLTAAKMALVMYRLKDRFIRFSRRGGESRWAKYVEPELAIDPDSDLSLSAFYGQLLSERYQAVNVRNRGTVEIRIFRGSLVPTTVLACIELVSNLVLFTRDHTTAECLAVTWDELAEYEHHEELSDYCSRRMTDTSGYTENAVRVKHTNESSGASGAPNLYPGGEAVTLSDDAESTLHPGDIVYMVGPDTDRDSPASPAAGKFGLVFGADGTGGGAWIRCAWFSPNPCFWGSSADATYRDGDSRSWGVRRVKLRRVMRIGNRDITRQDGDATLDTYWRTGLLPGDRVRSEELPGGEEGTYLLVNGDFAYAADVVWDRLNFGHDLSGMLTGGAANHGRRVASLIRI